MRSSPLHAVAFFTLLFGLVAVVHAQPRYTTQGKHVVDRETGEPVLLQGFGLGGWLLPEGYMWGLRTLDRPRQFEAAIEDLIGEEDAATFWRLYHENFVTEGDFRAMKAMGANSVRIALLASKLQPRQGQPDQPPFVYSDEGFRFLDSVVVWSTRHALGVIWDMHGAPGAQNAENISDSDGEARLWTEKATYWPRLIHLWHTIAERYAGNPAIIGYDLLNEPLLRRYEGIDPALLRELYVVLTDTLRAVDPYGLIFVEGDDWAQNFEMLEPLDWDPHLVLAFHSYPPTSTQEGLQRWDDLREQYDVPLWHGETGEQLPPYDLNRRATTFLNGAGVGWNWWTHKKLSRASQPWLCPPTEGFQQILDYWQGNGPRPSREDAKAWLFDQARKLHTDYCEFLPEMVRSLVPFDPEAYLALRDTTAPEIFQQPQDATVEVGGVAVLRVRARGFPLRYQWTRNGVPLDGADGPAITVTPHRPDDGAVYAVRVFNEKGAATSTEATLTVQPFAGPVAPKAAAAPEIDGHVDAAWAEAERLPITRTVDGLPAEADDLAAAFRVLWDDENLYLLVEVADEVCINTDPREHHNDGVEVYVDVDNSKSMAYADDTYQLRAIWRRPGVIVNQGTPGDGIRIAQSDTADGYVMEWALPWAALGGTPGGFVGLDVHVNDNDRDRRESKLAWAAEKDDAYLSPTVFGTIQLGQP